LADSRQSPSSCCLCFRWGSSFCSNWSRGPSLFRTGSLADLFGFLALALIAATGVLMLFKTGLTSRMGTPERLWRVHIVIAGAGGLFLGLHVALFLAFPLSLAVLLGYAATGAALFVWITGGIYFQGVRNSTFYHGLLSIGAIFLMVVHTFGAGRNLPVEFSGLSLAFDGGGRARGRHLARGEGLEG